MSRTTKLPCGCTHTDTHWITKCAACAEYDKAVAGRWREEYYRNHPMADRVRFDVDDQSVATQEIEDNGNRQDETPPADTGGGGAVGESRCDSGTSEPDRSPEGFAGLLDAF